MPTLRDTCLHRVFKSLQTQTLSEPSRILNYFDMFWYMTCCNYIRPWSDLDWQLMSANHFRLNDWCIPGGLLPPIRISPFTTVCALRKIQGRATASNSTNVLELRSPVPEHFARARTAFWYSDSDVCCTSKVFRSHYTVWFLFYLFGILIEHEPERNMYIYIYTYLCKFNTIISK